MKKFVVVGVLLVLVGVGAAHAILPAFVIPIAEVIGGVAVRSAGRQLVANLSVSSTASGSFAAAMAALRGSQVAQWIGIGVPAAVFAVNKDIPEAPQLGTDMYAIRVAARSETDYTPAPVRTRTTDAAFELIDGRSTFGATPAEVFANWRQRCTNAPDCAAKYGAIGDPVIKDYGWMTSVEFSTTNYPKRWDSWANRYEEGTNFDIGTTEIEPRDGTRRVRYSDGAIKPDETDPDWDKKSLQEFADNKQVVFTGTNDKGEASRVVLNAADKNLSVYTDVETSINGKPAVVRNSIAINPLTGEAVNTEGLTRPGVGLESVALPADSALSGTDSPVGAWPDDYARQQTLSSVDIGVGRVANSTEAIKDLLEKKDDVADPDMPDQGDIQAQLSYFDQFKELLSWRMPNVAVTCPKLEYQNVISGYTFDIRVDAHCNLMTPEHIKMLDNIMIAAWTILALFIILGA